MGDYDIESPLLHDPLREIGGSQGRQGNQGRQGVQGFQGNQGRQGERGNQGWQGSAGDDGVQGHQGWQGIGTQGAQGNQGNQGAVGEGTQGAQGNQGLEGLQGNQGNQGAVGAQGNQGFQGLQGSQGNQGFQGTANGGAQGYQGYQGIQGANNLVVSMGNDAIPYFETNATTYAIARSFVFEGTTSWGVPTGVVFLTGRSSVAVTMAARIYDITNGNIVCESLGISGDYSTITVNGVLVSLPAGRATFEIQFKRTAGDGATAARGYSITLLF